MKKRYNGPQPQRSREDTTPDDRERKPLSEVLPCIYVTVAEAWEQFGIPRARIYTWKHRGLIEPVERDGQTLYPAERLAILNNAADCDPRATRERGPVNNPYGVPDCIVPIESLPAPRRTTDGMFSRATGRKRGRPRKGESPRWPVR